MSQHQCYCGCAHFRFKFQDNIENIINSNICRNCEHTLAQHLDIRKQAE